MPPAYASGLSVALRYLPTLWEVILYAGHQLLGAGDDPRLGAAHPVPINVQAVKHAHDQQNGALNALFDQYIHTNPPQDCHVKVSMA